MRQMFQRVPPSTLAANVRDVQIRWLDDVLARTGWSLSRLAAESGASDTTLTRFRNKADYSGRLSQDVVAKIVARTGFPGPEIAAPEAPRYSAGLREDAALWAPEGDGGGDALVDAALRGRNNAHPWVMKSDVLALVGVRAGDIMIIDQAEAPRDGDVVCAQQTVGVGARTLFRLWQVPNLCVASFDPTAARPIPVDGVDVQIVGVMTDLIRRRS